MLWFSIVQSGFRYYTERPSCYTIGFMLNLQPALPGVDKAICDAGHAERLAVNIQAKLFPLDEPAWPLYELPGWDDWRHFLQEYLWYTSVERSLALQSLPDSLPILPSGWE